MLFTSLRTCLLRRFSAKTASIPSFEKLATLISRFDQKEMASLQLSAQYKSFLTLNKHKIKSLAQCKADFDFIQAECSKETDTSLEELFDNEIESIKAQIQEINQELYNSIFTNINEGIKEVVVEIRPGTGGDEAAMFAKELSIVYENYFKYKDWRFEVISETSDTIQLRELIYSVSGESFADLQFETGVHRVQRVPKTDSQGRIHTSTVTVAVIPQRLDDVSLLNEKDVRIDVFRSSGPGGQNVNKTNSAVRLVHVPTGITVSMQDERSQILNKIKAFKVLEFRLQERNRSLKSLAIKSLRSEQIGAGERSDKIRTYNFPQNRITDHRSGHTTQNLPLFFEDPSILEKHIELNKLDQVNTFIDEMESQLKNNLK